MNLTKIVPPKYSYIFLIFVFAVGLVSILFLHYTLNIQYQEKSEPFSKGPVTKAPKTLRLDLDQPDDDSLIFEDSIIVSGQTAPNKDVLIITTSKDLVIKSKGDGSFSTVLDLEEGVNKITVSVYDQGGDSRSAERTVYYSEEKL